MGGIDESLRSVLSKILYQIFLKFLLQYVESCGMIYDKDYRGGGRMIRIAVVDDEKEILEFVTDRIIRALNHFKYEAKVDRYLSGKTFLKSNDNYEYDIVFLDLEMPGFNGLQTARSIRIDFPNEIIVIVTKVNRIQSDL